VELCGVLWSFYASRLPCCDGAPHGLPGGVTIRAPDLAVDIVEQADRAAVGAAIHASFVVCHLSAPVGVVEQGAIAYLKYSFSSPAR